MIRSISASVNDLFASTLAKGISNYVLGTSPGDFNADGRVDAADYTAWRDRGGTQAEYQMWRSNFGGSGGIVSAAGNAVPEPAEWFLIGMGIAAVILFAIRRVR